MVSTISDSDPTMIPTLTTSAPRLPAELTDTIIDCLRDDDDSLANCSLVCKEWFPAARNRLFGRLPSLHPWNIEAFVNLITHPSATILPYIHHLTINQVRFRRSHVELFQAIFHRLPRFDRLSGLELRNIQWRNYSESSIDALISSSKNITDLALDSLTFDDPVHLRSVVTGFPSLQRLSVKNVAFLHQLPQSTTGLDAALQYRIPLKIRDLRLREMRNNPTHVLDWFLSHGTLVHSLSVDVGILALPSLNRYLQLLGPSLRFFQIDVCSGLAEKFLSQLDLSFNTHLRKLRLYNFCFGSRQALSILFPSMLAKITSPHVSEIEFAYGTPERSDFLLKLANDAKSTTPSSSIWTTLNDVLSIFTHLRTVRFRLDPHQRDPLLFTGYVKRGLSSCDARGVLSFEQYIDGQYIHSRPNFQNGTVTG